MGRNQPLSQAENSMLRLGAPASETREMDLDDLFISRLKLMIITARAYLGGCPLSEHRRRAMLKNARVVEAECIDLGGLDSPANLSLPNHSIDEIPGGPGQDQLFYRRVKLVAVMVKAAAKGYPLGESRKTELQDHLQRLGQILKFDSHSGDWKFLKAASSTGK
jgi:hypothetical protein